ncbi:hypothetical protein Tco_0371863 [Tanacetum coccineum]
MGSSILSSSTEEDDLGSGKLSSKKSGFFFIDRRAILDAMVWRHPDATIDDPRPSAGSFNMADVRHLSAHVIKLRDMPESVLVLSGLIRVWKSHVDSLKASLLLHSSRCDAVIPEPTPEDLAVGTPSSKIVAKTEASQKRKASTFGATLSHVSKRTRSTLGKSSNITTHPSLFVGDDDDDACVLVAPLCFAAVIPYLGNQGGSSAAPTAEGKGVMVDDVAVPSVGESQSRPSSEPTPSFRNVFGDAIHTDFFPFSAGPYYATYPVDDVAGNCEFTREEWDAPYRPTFGVLTKEVFKDPAICKMGEMLLAHYHRLNQSYHEHMLSTDSRLKGYEEKVSSLTGLELQSKAKGKERKKKIKSLTKSVDNLHSEVARLSTDLNQATILKAEKDEEILRLKTTPPEFFSFFRGQFQDLVRKFCSILDIITQ